MSAWNGLSDVEMVFLVLAGIYCWECVCWLRLDAVCFSSGWGECRPLRSAPPFQNDRGRLVFTNPLPIARSFVCQPWPISLDPHGLIIDETATASDDGARKSSRRSLPYEAIKSVSRQERDVLVNGAVAATLTSEAHAEFVAARLRGIVAADASNRPQVIEDLLDERTSVEQISQHLQQFRQAVSTLRLGCTVLAGYAFVGGPVLYYSSALTWRQFAGWYLAGFLLGWFYLVYRCDAVRQTIGAENRSARLWHTTMLLLSPASAMRAAEALSRNVLADAEPLAAAAVVCSADDFSRFAETSLRTTLYPIREGDSAPDVAAERTQCWFSEQCAERMRRVIDSAGLDSAALLKAPHPSDDATAYCPRCLRQFSRDEGCCHECPGVPLAPFAPVSERGDVSLIQPRNDDADGRLAEAAVD
jgi:hypothetical protein